MIRWFWTTPPPKRVIVTPKTFDSLMILSTLKGMGLLTDTDFSERAKRICPDLESGERHELVVDERGA